MKKMFQLLFFLALILGAILAYVYFCVFEQKINTGDKEEVYFYLKSNSSFDDVMNGLVERKIVSSKSKFAWLAELRHLKGNIYPGRYSLNSGMSYTDLVLYLRQGKIDEVQVTFNNVRTLSQLAEKLSDQIEASEDELLYELTNEGVIAERGYAKETFLAVFIPNSYKMYWNSSAKDFVDRMVKEHKKFWNKNRLKKAEALKLSPVEVSTLASIVQSEQNRFPDEWPVISGLYLNRLKKGMNELIKIYDLEEMLECSGYPCRSVMTIKKFGKYKKPLITKSLIQQELMFREVLWSQYHSISYSHKNSHIDKSLNAFEAAFKKLKNIVKNNNSIENNLLGKPCETVFTRVADFQSVATSQRK